MAREASASCGSASLAFFFPENLVAAPKAIISSFQLRVLPDLLGLRPADKPPRELLEMDGQWGSGRSGGRPVSRTRWLRPPSTRAEMPLSHSTHRLRRRARGSEYFGHFGGAHSLKWHTIGTPRPTSPPARPSYPPHFQQMPTAGLEPARCFHQRILSPLRLPISPRRPVGDYGCGKGWAQGGSEASLGDRESGSLGSAQTEAWLEREMVGRAGEAAGGQGDELAAPRGIGSGQNAGLAWLDTQLGAPEYVE